MVGDANTKPSTSLDHGSASIAVFFSGFSAEVTPKSHLLNCISSRISSGLELDAFFSI